MRFYLLFYFTSQNEATFCNDRQHTVNHKYLACLHMMSSKNLASKDTINTTEQNLSYKTCTNSHTDRSTCSEKFKQGKCVKKIYAKNEPGRSVNTFHYKCILCNRDMIETVASFLYFVVISF